MLAAMQFGPRIRTAIRWLLYTLTFAVVAGFTSLTLAGWNNDLQMGAGIYVNLPQSIFLVMLVGDVLAASGLVLGLSAWILRIIERRPRTEKKVRIYKPGEE